MVVNKRDMTSVNSIVFSQPKSLGNFKKIVFLDSEGKKITIETENCFSWGIQKSDRYESYSMPLVLKNDSETLKNLKGVLEKCKDHLPENEFGKCLYEKTETTTIYPKLKYYEGKFNTDVYEGDVEIDPRKYLNVKCDARALIHVEAILLGDKTTLLIKVLEAEVSEKLPKKRQLSRKSRD